MLKTPEQVLEEIKEFFEKVKIKWEELLLEEKKIELFHLYGKRGPQTTEWIKQVWTWIDEALKKASEKNEIAVWRELYKDWNGTDDLSMDKYDGKKDLYGRLADLQEFLVEWEKATLWKEQQQELEKSRKIIELLQNELVSKLGETSLKEFETKMEVLKKDYN